MTGEAARLAQMRALLPAWFDRHQRDLPWRGIDDPYLTWVSEIMLQQTQVERVVPYFERFSARFPTVHDLAAAPIDEALKLWEGLGYYSRARNLHAAARVVVERHGGCFPDSFEDALALPGIGEYTAGAILSIARGVPVPAIDANAARVLARVMCVRGRTDEAQFRRRVREIAEEAMPDDRPGDFNQALMELGALICIAGRPGCLICPLTEVCLARLQGVQEEIPPPTSRPTRETAEAVAVVRDGPLALVAQRPEEGHWAGLWEFPGIEATDGDDPAVTLADALRERLDIEVKVGEMLAEFPYGIMNRRVRLSVFGCRLLAGETRPSWHAAVRWLPPEALPELAMPSPHRTIADMLAAHS